MRTVPTHVRPQHGPIWFRNPVARVLVLAAAGAVASVAALGLSAAATGPEDVDHPTEVAADLEQIQQDLMAYRAFTGTWPASMAELYAGHHPTDPWGHPYVFVPPTVLGSEPDVASFGADQWPGGERAFTDRWMSDVVGELSPTDPPAWGIGSS